MKTFLIVNGLLTVLAFNSYGQDNNWITLKYPQSDILGKVVRNINGGDFDYDPSESLSVKNPNSVNGPAYIYDYKESYKSFLSQFITDSKTKISEVEIKNLKLRSISINDALNMKTGLQYVYEGISADTFELKVSRKKEVNIDYSKGIKSIFEFASKEINKTKLTGILDNVFKIVDSVRNDKTDSVIYKLRIYSPDIYFKVKVVKYNQLTKRDWEAYFKYFANGTKLLCKGDKEKTPPKTIDLMNLRNKNSTLSKFPDFWGRQDLKSIQVKIGVERINKQLELFVYYTDGKARANLSNPSDNMWVAIKLEYKKSDNGKRFWDIDRLLIYSFFHNGVDKQVIVSISAEEIDETTIQLINWDSENNGDVCNRQPRTILFYPEVQLEYIRD